jgi:aminoglycoside phosphotransferase (APT) family kinase protein
VVHTETVQRLWSGYGQIVRCRLDGGRFRSVIVKHVRWPDQLDHPRGWNSRRSHERKVRSYQVETAWYDRFAAECADSCRVPRSLALEGGVDEVVMVLEDLDASGFAGRRQLVGDAELEACLRWLASFHATFVGERPDGLWPTGTYWHLDTRPDELDALEDGPLKDAAAAIDRQLANSAFVTFVHGDAKLANFCFDTEGRRAAAVDFQYVGGGCGMKDVAYFISSCLDEDDSEAMAPALLDRYFELLASALAEVGKALDFAALEADWRALYPVAWTDFYRFLQGWSPGHWKLHRYSERLAREVLASL